jgi:hypothetical protein
MKVRGRRNRAKLAARHTTRQIMHVKLGDPTDGRMPVHAAPPGEATHMIVVNGPTRDGYGRIVPTPAPRPVLAPRRAGKSSWSMGFTLKSDVDADALYDLLTGKGESVNATG